MGPAVSGYGSPSREITPLESIGALAMLPFVYAFTSGVLDGSLRAFHIPMITGSFATVCALVSGRMIAGAKTRPGILYIALTCFFALGVPFSIWRGGSIAVFKDFLRALLVWACLVGLISPWRNTKRLLNTIAFASVSAAMAGVMGGMSSMEGRLVIQGRFSNPNELALALLIGLPLLWRLYSDGGRRGALRKAAALGGLAVTMVGFFKSGSRGALFALMFGTVLVLLRAPMMVRLRVIAGAAVVFVIALATLPQHLRDRYFTFGSVDVEQGENASENMVSMKVAGAAAASTENRKALLFESIATTLRFPIFGVGLGNFPSYQAGLRKDTGVRADWLGTHNTYTQLSSEAGIPALLLFIAILAIGWRSLSRLIRETRDDPRPEARDIFQTAHAVQVCLGMFCFFLCFLHAGYELLTHTVTALALVVDITARRELALRKWDRPPGLSAQPVPQVMIGA